MLHRGCIYIHYPQSNHRREGFAPNGDGKDRFKSFFNRRTLEKRNETFYTYP